MNNFHELKANILNFNVDPMTTFYPTHASKAKPISFNKLMSEANADKRLIRLNEQNPAFRLLADLGKRNQAMMEKAFGEQMEAPKEKSWLSKNPSKKIQSNVNADDVNLKRSKANQHKKAQSSSTPGCVIISGLCALGTIYLAGAISMGTMYGDEFGSSYPPPKISELWNLALIPLSLIGCLFIYIFLQEMNNK